MSKPFVSKAIVCLKHEKEMGALAEPSFILETIAVKSCELKSNIRSTTDVYKYMLDMLESELRSVYGVASTL